MWNEERTNELQMYWARGYSCSEIAKKIGGVSKNSIIGKVHRLGLERRRTGSNKRPTKLKASADQARVKAKASKPKAPIAPVAEPLPPLEPVVVRKTFAQLEDSDCKWPSGDPREPGFGFCGLPKSKDKPYCPDCQRRASNGPAKVINGFAMRGAINRLGLG